MICIYGAAMEDMLILGGLQQSLLLSGLLCAISLRAEEAADDLHGEGERAAPLSLGVWIQQWVQCSARQRSGGANGVSVRCFSCCLEAVRLEGLEAEHG